jgi:hypothetical protein
VKLQGGTMGRQKSAGAIRDGEAVKGLYEVRRFGA